ncbi:MAG: hypothetical protein RIB86_10735 [Imperialibacter sp.]
MGFNPTLKQAKDSFGGIPPCSEGHRKAPSGRFSSALGFNPTLKQAEDSFAMKKKWRLPTTAGIINVSGNRKKDQGQLGVSFQSIGILKVKPFIIVQHWEL